MRNSLLAILLLAVNGWAEKSGVEFKTSTMSFAHPTYEYEMELSTGGIFTITVNSNKQCFDVEYQITILIADAYSLKSVRKICVKVLDAK